MGLYEDAYGLTRLRLLVDVFEGWLGLVVVGVDDRRDRAARAVAAPDRTALRRGDAAGAGIANPDAWIAEHNVERYQATGKVDYVLPALG